MRRKKFNASIYGHGTIKNPAVCEDGRVYFLEERLCYLIAKYLADLLYC